MINVWGDSVGATIVEKLAKESLDKAAEAESVSEKKQLEAGVPNAAFQHGTFDSKL